MVFQARGTAYAKAYTPEDKLCVGVGYILGRPLSTWMLKIAMGVLALSFPNNLFVIWTIVRITYNKTVYACI